MVTWNVKSGGESSLGSKSLYISFFISIEVSSFSSLAKLYQITRYYLVAVPIGDSFPSTIPYAVLAINKRWNTLDIVHLPSNCWGLSFLRFVAWQRRNLPSDLIKNPE